MKLFRIYIVDVMRVRKKNIIENFFAFPFFSSFHDQSYSLNENDEDYMLLLPIFYHFDLVPCANLLDLIPSQKHKQ